jgi:hypothetical protein
VRARAALLAAIALLALAAATARADDLGDEGFGVPTAPPWPEARERLVVQLRPARQSGAPNAIFRQDVPGTRTALVLAPDDPGTDPSDVTLADALSWNKTAEDLFAYAIDNLDRRYPPQVRETPELRHGVKVKLFYGLHRYAAGYALAIERREPCLGRKGALVVVANQHAMLCYPVESARTFDGYLALVNMAADITMDGDDPLVPDVFWYHDGIWDPQRVTVEGDRFDHERSPAFVKLLKELRQGTRGPRARRF